MKKNFTENLDSKQVKHFITEGDFLISWLIISNMSATTFKQSPSNFYNDKVIYDISTKVDFVIISRKSNPPNNYSLIEDYYQDTIFEIK